MHPLVAATQHEESVQALTAVAMHTREISENSAGLTSLGSLDHYNGDKKVTEDVTELMTMFTWDPDYFGEYTDFLADAKNTDLQRNLGLVSLRDGANLYAIVADATVTALSGR
jgi:hypothetical protein